MMDFVWKTFSLDLNNRCRASMNNIENSEDFTFEVERFNGVICGPLSEADKI